MFLGKKFSFGKILFSNTTIFLRFEGDEKACEPSESFNVTWYLRYSDCYNEVFNFGDEQADNYFGTTAEEHPGWSGYYATASLSFKNCSELFRPQIFYKEFVHPEPLSPEKREGLKDKKEIAGNHTMVTDKTAMNAVIKTWRDGPYIFIVQIGVKRTERTTPSSYENKHFTMTVELKGPYEYLSLADYPLMIVSKSAFL